MRMSLLISALAVLIVGTDIAVENHTKAMTLDTGTAPQVVRVADISTDGIRTWTRMMELGGLEAFGKSPQTLFVPADAAFESIPTDEVKELLAPGRSELRRAVLARGATDSRVTPQQIAGKRISVTTLDGRPLTIDATGEELMVGDSEALAVRTLPDGRVMYVLDHMLAR
jgi:uncharacterized surface protein with fasciclin (FAS1) repeats